MFDFHMHSRVSFDGHASGLEMALAAKNAGLKEICFTDHLDYDPSGRMQNIAFDTAVYNAEYDSLHVDGLTIRRGAEFGMTPDNQARFRTDIQRRPFDFVLGSVHFVDGVDVYFSEFFEGKTALQAQRRYLEATLECVRAHEDYDVLAHRTFISKAGGNPDPRPIRYEDHRALLDEILKTLAARGKGLELNTSGMDRCGDYLPPAEYFARFRELGGRIVTVGSDAHTPSRVGQYSREACTLLKDIFGYVCTFQGREPLFHTL